MRRSSKVFTLFLCAILLTNLPQYSVNAASNTPVSKNDVASFWTAERINKAIAFDMVFENGSKSANRVAVAKGAGKNSGGSTTNVLGASWKNGGLPLTATGKVFFAIGNSYYQCSGSLVSETDTAKAIVLTAGHCVYDNASKKYVENWIFIPSYDVTQVSISGCATSNYCWTAFKLSAHDNFTNEVSFTSIATLYDWGFATITEKKNDILPDNLTTLNSFPIQFASVAKGTSANSFGYPAAGKYSGKDLVYSNGFISFDSSNANLTYSLPSDMSGGCSGGPWLTNMAGAPTYSGTLTSVNSYKYGQTNYIYGPKFNSETRITYSSAIN